MQIPDELDRAGLIPAGLGFALQFVVHIAALTAGGRNAVASEQLGVVGGADGTWVNASDGRYSAGSRGPAHWGLVMGLVHALGLVTGLVHRAGSPRPGARYAGMLIPDSAGRPWPYLGLPPGLR